MKSYALCPISDKTIDEYTVRIAAILTVLVITAYLLTGILLLMLLLAIDFLLRAIPMAQYSPLALISRGLTQLLQVGKQPINAGPKILAARVGFIITALVVVTHELSWENAPLILAAILGLFSFLEGAFGLCVACKIYPWLYLAMYKSKFDSL